MKITFMGTSHGYAEKNRFTSATLIETNDFSYLLDAGAPVEWIMENTNKPYDKIRGIFITHMHNDHVGSLSQVIEPMLRFRYNDKSTCFFPSKEGMEAFTKWLVALSATEDKIKSTVKFEVTQTGRIFNNGDMIVFAKPTLHMGENGKAFSYTFESEGKKVLFTGDMGMGFPEYSEITGNERYDLVVCEMAHAKLCDVKDALKNTNTERMIIHHYYEPMIEDCDEILKSFPFPASIAKDDMEVII